MNQALEDQRLTIRACVLVAATSLAFASFEGPALGPVIRWIDLAHAALAMGMGLLLWLRRDRPSILASQVVFAIVGLFYLPDSWVTELIAARLGLPRDPLVSHQLFAVGTAMLVPGRMRFGASLIALTLVSALSLWWFLTAQHGVQQPGAEPWTTLIFGGLALGLLWLRGQRQETMRRIVHAEAELASLTRIARMSLALRDNANTPLQTLCVGIELLKRGRSRPESIGQMERAIAALRKLSTTLASAEDWELPALDLSADLARELEDAARSLNSAFRKESRPG